jgi:hypothetical protein
LWPSGDIKYGFASGVTQAEKDWVESLMGQWEAATADAIDFNACTPGSNCPTIYLQIRKNTTAENGAACTYGRVSGATLRFGADDANTMLHKLGHCVGLYHEHQRSDRDRFLVEGDYVYPNDDQHNTLSLDTLPILGNYDYDSVMHYAFYTLIEGTDGTLRRTDQLGNTFSRWHGNQISIHDASRVVQYYARNYQPNWDFFTSLATAPANADSLPNGYLASFVEAVGTPAIAYSNGTTHTFARGSNDHIYWKTGTTPGGWTSLGCCAGSDPAAVATDTGQIDLAFIGASSGKLIRTRRAADGAWGGWFYVQDGLPPGGIRPALDGDGYVGPAIASRANNQMDFFVVRAADGLLSTISYNGSWSGWQTLSGPSYYVRARPAAVALSTPT